MLALGVSIASLTVAEYGFDAATITGITRVEAEGGTLTTAAKQAIDTFIRALKTQGVWDAIATLWLFVGGNAASHQVNWRQPGTNDIAGWYNSPTHSTNGVQFGGTSYGDTGLNTLDVSAAGFFVYVNVLNTVDTDFPLIAAQQSFGDGLENVIAIATDNSLVTLFGVLSARSGDAMPPRSTGFILGGRTSETNLVQRIGGTNYAHTTNTSGFTGPYNSAYLGAYNFEGAATLHGDGSLAMAGVFSVTPTSSKFAAFDAACVTLQTALGRA